MPVKCDHIRESFYNPFIGKYIMFNLTNIFRYCTCVIRNDLMVYEINNSIVITV